MLMSLEIDELGCMQLNRSGAPTADGCAVRFHKRFGNGTASDDNRLVITHKSPEKKKLCRAW
jgi:hypothetical protein